MDGLPIPKRNSGLAFKTESGEWIVAYPGELLYSTVTMSATHFSEDGNWRALYED